MTDRELLKNIASELDGIHEEDLTPAERQIAKLLIGVNSYLDMNDHHELTRVINLDRSVPDAFIKGR